MNNLQGIKPQSTQAKQEYRLGRLDLASPMDGVVRRVDRVGGHGRLGGGHALGHAHQPADVDRCVRRVVAFLPDARVVAVLADLREVPRALGAVARAAAGDAVEGDDVTLVGR